MKRYLKSIFPKIINYSKKLDDFSVLTDKQWVVLSEDTNAREVWIFKNDGNLIISLDGIADKGTWDYFKEAKSIYIEVGKQNRLFNLAFVDDIALLMKLDGTNQVFAFANENKIQKEFKLLQYLDEKYVRKPKPLPIKPPKDPEQEKSKELIAQANYKINQYVFRFIGIIVLSVIFGIFLFNSKFNIAIYISILIYSILFILLSYNYILYIQEKKFLKRILKEQHKHKQKK